jgi:hypothetical protein
MTTHTDDDDLIRSADLRVGDGYEDLDYCDEATITVTGLEHHGDHTIITGTRSEDGSEAHDVLDRDAVVTLVKRAWLEVTDPGSGTPHPELCHGVNLSISAPSGDIGTTDLNLRVTDEGIILDHYDADGNCVGTIAGSFADWAVRADG